MPLILPVALPFLVLEALPAAFFLPALARAFGCELRDALERLPPRDRAHRNVAAVARMARALQVDSGGARTDGQAGRACLPVSALSRPMRL